MRTQHNEGAMFGQAEMFGQADMFGLGDKIIKDSAGAEVARIRRGNVYYVAPGYTVTKQGVRKAIRRRMRRGMTAEEAQASWQAAKARKARRHGPPAWAQQGPPAWAQHMKMDGDDMYPYEYAEETTATDFDGIGQGQAYDFPSQMLAPLGEFGTPKGTVVSDGYEYGEDYDYATQKLGQYGAPTAQPHDYPTQMLQPAYKGYTGPADFATSKFRDPITGATARVDGVGQYDPYHHGGEYNRVGAYDVDYASQVLINKRKAAGFGDGIF
ncbi:MAG: hypothetical protein GTO22_03895 [Gemmatimonadales bacterium]|nr:hypothetical protein [Gemmatimonadales bacterium]